MKDSLAMRLARPARWRRDAQSLTRQRDRRRESASGFEKPSTDRLSGQLRSRGQDALKGERAL